MFSIKVIKPDGTSYFTGSFEDCSAAAKHIGRIFKKSAYSNCTFEIVEVKK